MITQARAPSFDEFARVTRRTIMQGDCLVWIGATQRKHSTRHGKIRVGSRTDGTRRMAYTHRIIWTYYNGPIPPGLQINHRCGNSLCVKISHLYCGTQQDNMRDRDRERAA